MEAGFLVTACHVVGENQSLHFGVLDSETFNADLQRWKLELKSAELVAKDEFTDLAILKTGDYVCPCPLPIDTERVLGIDPVYCYEYSRTFSLATGEGLVEGSTRVGNVVRYVDDHSGSALFPSKSLELSFPGVQGASGSPILSRREQWAVIGVMKANATYELLPIQSIRVLDEIDGTQISEETQFYLPQGLAVNSTHLEALIATNAKY